MKIIKDIRLYKSEVQNQYGNPIVDKKLNAIIRRIVMKLRENSFSLGDFDHLYINFTILDVNEKMILSDEVDIYHPWYRNCFVGIEKELLDNIGTSDVYDCIIDTINEVLRTYFVTEEFDEEFINSCFEHAIEQGESMLSKFREKKTAKRKAVIFLRYLDDCMYYPLLRVYDENGVMLFEKDLPKTLELDYLGEIQVSLRRVSIKPRKNAYNIQKEAMSFEY